MNFRQKQQGVSLAEYRFSDPTRQSFSLGLQMAQTLQKCVLQVHASLQNNFGANQTSGYFGLAMAVDVLNESGKITEDLTSNKTHPKRTK